MKEAADASAGKGERRRGVLLVLVAGLLYSSAGLFTRALPFDAWTVLAWRSLYGAVFLVLLTGVERGPLALRSFRMSRSHQLLVPLTALGTICYIFALKLTSVANVMIVYATTPFVTAAVAWMWSRETPTPRTMVASSLALVGVGIMIGGGSPTEGRIVGVALTLLMNVTFALALVLARRRPRESMTPVNALGLLLAAVVSFGFAPGQAIGGVSMLLLAGFGVITIGLAMSLFMAGARLIPSAEVALVGVSDTVLGPFFVWLAFGENPGPAAMIGGGVVLTALVWHLWPEARQFLGLGRTLPREAI